MSDRGHDDSLTGNIRNEISLGDERVEWSMASPPHTFPISVREADRDLWIRPDCSEDSYLVDAVEDALSLGMDLPDAIAQATIEMSSTADFQNVWNILGDDGLLLW